MLLRASSTADMEKWIRILRQQASFAQGGNGTSIVLNSNPISFDKSKRNSSLANELDRALNQLDQLESEAACKSEGPAHQGAAPMSVVINERNLSAMGMDKNPDVRSMRHIKVPSPTGTGSGSDFIRSVDSEITIGKMHVANQGYGNPSSVQHGKNVTMTDDREIAIRHKSQDAGPHDQSHNDSAILHYTDEDDEEDDAVHEFSMIQDDDDIQYIERMHLEAKNINSSGKCDYVNSASEAKRESEYRGNKSVYRK